MALVINFIDNQIESIKSRKKVLFQELARFAADQTTYACELNLSEIKKCEVEIDTLNTLRNNLIQNNEVSEELIQGSKRMMEKLNRILGHLGKEIDIIQNKSNEGEQCEPTK